MKQLKRKEFWQGVISIILFGILIYSGAHFVGTTDIQEKVGRAGVWAPAAFILIKSSTIIFAPLNGAPVYLVAHRLFPFQYAFLYLLLGDLLGFTVVFYLSRHFGKRLLQKLLTENQFDQMQKFLLRTANWKGLILTRLSLPGFADLISYGVGLSHIPYWQYILVTIPFVILNITIMLTLGTAFIDSIKDYLILIAVFVIGSFLLLQLRRVIRKKNSTLGL